MKNKLGALTLGLLALVSQGYSANTQMNLTLASPILGGSDIFTLRVGTYSAGVGTLSTDISTAIGQLNSGFTTAYTASNLNGAAITETLISTTVTSPFATGLDNNVLFWLTDTTNTYFALFTGAGLEWIDPVGELASEFGAVDDIGFAADSVTAVFGSFNTSAGPTGTLYATAIPEPASGSLFLLGAAGVLALRRLRKSNV